MGEEEGALRGAKEGESVGGEVDKLGLDDGEEDGTVGERVGEMVNEFETKLVLVW